MPNKVVIPKTNKNTLFIALSFGTIFILIFMTLAIVVLQVSAANAEINNIISINNTKTRLLVDMQIAARERSLSLYRMLAETDPFGRDDAFMQFRNTAQAFINAREHLMAMPLSNTEKQLIKRQGELSRKTSALQYQIIDLLYQENFRVAADQLTNSTMPMQKQVLSQLDKLIELQNYNNALITQELKNNLQQNIARISALGIVLLLLIVSIALFGIRYISRTEEKLLLEKNLAQTTLHSIGDGVVTLDKNNKIKSINAVAEKLLGTNGNQVLGKSILTLYQHNKESEQVKIKNMLAQTKRSLLDLPLQQLDQSTHQIEHTIAPIIDENKNIQGAVIVLRDVTRVRSLEKRLSYQATHDSLTGLINRREFEVRLNQLIRNAQTEKREHTICFLDLDKFKTINDTAGHAAGDEFLKQVSAIIQSSLRKADTLARLGGDEFAILLDNCSLKRGETICQQIIDNVNNINFHWDNHHFQAGVSIGIARITHHTRSIKKLMQAVDAACYQAKKSGRNQFQSYQEEKIASA